MKNEIRSKLIPNAEAAAEIGVSTMTLTRWDLQPEKFGYAPPIRIGVRLYRERERHDEFVRRLLQQGAKRA